MTTLIPKFEQPYTGAVNIPINIKLQETVSVIDFGADPTGVADSYAAFLAAYNSGAGTIIVPLGTFKLTQSLKIDRALTINGDTSAGTNNLSPANTSLISFTGTGAAFEFTATDVNGTRNGSITNLSILGTSAGSCGILFGNTVGAYATMCSVINVQITGFTATNACGLLLKYCLLSYFRNVTTFNNYDGIKCQGTNTTITFESCYSLLNTRYGWFIDTSMVSGNFINCTSESNQSSGLYISGNVASSNFYNWHSESNCASTGLAPQVLTNNGADYPSYITFYSGYFADYVGAGFKTFDITGCSRITWYEPTMSSYSAGFMSVTSTTASCNFNIAAQTIYPSSITNNTLTGVTINHGAPNQFSQTIVDSNDVSVSFTTGILLISDTTNNYSAIFALNGTGKATAIMSDPANKFSNTQTAGKIYVWMNSGTMRIGNFSGGTVKIVAQQLMPYF